MSAEWAEQPAAPDNHGIPGKTLAAAARSDGLDGRAGRRPAEAGGAPGGGAGSGRLRRAAGPGRGARLRARLRQGRQARPGAAGGADRARRAGCRPTPPAAVRRDRPASFSEVRFPSHGKRTQAAAGADRWSSRWWSPPAPRPGISACVPGSLSGSTRRRRPATAVLTDAGAGRACAGQRSAMPRSVGAADFGAAAGHRRRRRAAGARQRRRRQPRRSPVPPPADRAGRRAATPPAPPRRQSRRAPPRSGAAAGRRQRAGADRARRFMGRSARRQGARR